MNVKPLDDRVLVKPTEAATQTASGLYLPESSKERPVHGKVVAVGPGKKLDSGERAKMNVKKGDVVVYGRYGGHQGRDQGHGAPDHARAEILGVLEGGNQSEGASCHRPYRTQ